jgi:hypothetical protein
MIVVAAFAGEGLGLSVAVVRGAGDPIWRDAYVVVGGVLGDIVDHAINGGKGFEIGVVVGVGWGREGGELFAWSVNAMLDIGHVKE